MSESGQRMAARPRVGVWTTSVTPDASRIKPCTPMPVRTERVASGIRRARCVAPVLGRLGALDREEQAVVPAERAAALDGLAFARGADRGQGVEFPPGGRGRVVAVELGRVAPLERVDDAVLPEGGAAVLGLLPAAGQAAFDRHARGARSCPRCRRRGRSGRGRGTWRGGRRLSGRRRRPARSPCPTGVCRPRARRASRSSGPPSRCSGKTRAPALEQVDVLRVGERVADSDQVGAALDAAPVEADGYGRKRGPGVAASVVAPEPEGVVALGGVDVPVVVRAGGRALGRGPVLLAQGQGGAVLPGVALDRVAVEVAGLVALGDVDPVADRAEPRAVPEGPARGFERDRGRLGPARGQGRVGPDPERGGQAVVGRVGVERRRDRAGGSPVTDRVGQGPLGNSAKPESSGAMGARSRLST